MDQGIPFECKLNCNNCNKVFGWIYDRRSHCRQCCTSVCKECSYLVAENNPSSRICKNTLTCQRRRYAKINNQLK